MNRIILIGNGFDLAHGMETSYQHFLNNYWKNTISLIKKSQRNKVFENDEFIIEKCPGNFIEGTNYKDLENEIIKFKTSINYKNKFLEILTDKHYLENWVDVEREYYELLKKSYKKEQYPKHNYNVSELNIDFEIIKNKLGEYLKNVEIEFNKNLGSEFLKTKNIIGKKIYDPFNLKDFSESSLNHKAEIEYNLIKKDIDALLNDEISIDELDDKKRKIISKINKNNALASIRELLLSDSAFTYFDLIPNQTLFLNFNYTSTESIYENPREFEKLNNEKYTSTKVIHIHGTTDNQDQNNIIFGFGDELDEEYSFIEKLNENAYLENIKSIKYLETDNYKKLLEFVNSESYQIFIFGHSCSVSDRTMLNTIFEHDNCASIKLFYHQQNEKNDNFSDIVRNITRNFNDKAKLRDRVVNKNYSEPLK